MASGILSAPWDRTLNYNLLSKRGVCDVRQGRGVRDMSKAISLFCKADSGSAGLARYELMPIQGSLERERRMPADLDGDMPPLRVEDMKRVVIYKGFLRSRWWLMPTSQTGA
jgi:hypothetical protein